MKRLLLLAFLAISFTVLNGQSLQLVRDTVNNFEIGVPIGWRYGVPKESPLVFVAINQTKNGLDEPRENFNIDIQRIEDTDMESSFKDFLSFIGEAEGFKVIEQGNKTVQGRIYRYVIETHLNHFSKENMHNYVLFINTNSRILVLTMVTVSANFEQYKPLFESIAETLKILEE